jgi:hypothetical protein
MRYRHIPRAGTGAFPGIRSSCRWPSPPTWAHHGPLPCAAHLWGGGGAWRIPIASVETASPGISRQYTYPVPLGRCFLYIMAVVAGWLRLLVCAVRAEWGAKEGSAAIMRDAVLLPGLPTPAISHAIDPGMRRTQLAKFFEEIEPTNAVGPAFSAELDAGSSDALKLALTDPFPAIPALPATVPVSAVPAAPPAPTPLGPTPAGPAPTPLGPTPASAASEDTTQFAAEKAKMQAAEVAATKKADADANNEKKAAEAVTLLGAPTPLGPTSAGPVPINLVGMGLSPNLPTPVPTPGPVGPKKQYPCDPYKETCFPKAPPHGAVPPDYNFRCSYSSTWHGAVWVPGHGR